MIFGEGAFSEFRNLEQDGIEGYVVEYRTRNRQLRDDIRTWEDVRARGQSAAVLATDLQSKFKLWRAQTENLSWALGGKEDPFTASILL
jgi:hypothetical protein